MSPEGKITLRNFRCFDWKNPAVIEFRNGFSAFVGANNSGKSALLRSIYELRELFHNFVHYIQQPNLPFTPIGITDIAELCNENDPERFHITIELDQHTHSQTHPHSEVISIKFEFRCNNQTIAPVEIRAIQPNGEFITVSGAAVRNVSTGQMIVLDFGQNNIMELSAIANFADSINRSRYFPAFRNAINEGGGQYYDLPVGTALVNTWDLWKAGHSRANKQAISLVEKEIAELLGFRSLQINADQTGKTLDIIIDDRPQKLYEVGSGVAQLIIVLAAALVNKPPYILIDEPELSLHPALQLKFLTTLASYAQNGLLYSTHSISLARSTAQRIYAVKRMAPGISQMHPFGEDQINFGGWLGELSYSNRVELGCEGLLLVEGTTDVLLFQEFLRKLGVDHKYVIMQLGGSSLIRGGVAAHLSELKRIISPEKIHIFIDSEKSSEGEKLPTERMAFIEDCSSLELSVHVSERRATENYLEAKAISKVLGLGYEPLTPFQKLEDAVKPWQKSMNWRIARETDFEDIRETDLGAFLLSLT